MKWYFRFGKKVLMLKTVIHCLQLLKVFWEMVMQMNCNVHQLRELGNECLLGVIWNLGKKIFTFPRFFFVYQKFYVFLYQKRGR